MKRCISKASPTCRRCICCLGVSQDFSQCVVLAHFLQHKPSDLFGCSVSIKLETQPGCGKKNGGEGRYPHLFCQRVRGLNLVHRQQISDSLGGGLRTSDGLAVWTAFHVEDDEAKHFRVPFVCMIQKNMSTSFEKSGNRRNELYRFP